MLSVACRSRSRARRGGRGSLVRRGGGVDGVDDFGAPRASRAPAPAAWSRGRGRRSSRARIRAASVDLPDPADPVISSAPRRSNSSTRLSGFEREPRRPAPVDRRVHRQRQSAVPRALEHGARLPHQRDPRASKVALGQAAAGARPALAPEAARRALTRRRAPRCRRAHGTLASPKLHVDASEPGRQQRDTADEQQLRQLAEAYEALASATLPGTTLDHRASHRRTASVKAGEPRRGQCATAPSPGPTGTLRATPIGCTSLGTVAVAMRLRKRGRARREMETPARPRRCGLSEAVTPNGQSRAGRGQRRDPPGIGEHAIFRSATCGATRRADSRTSSSGLNDRARGRGVRRAWAPAHNQLQAEGHVVRTERLAALAARKRRRGPIEASAARGGEVGQEVRRVWRSEPGDRVPAAGLAE